MIKITKSLSASALSSGAKETVLNELTTLLNLNYTIELFFQRKPHRESQQLILTSKMILNSIDKVSLEFGKYLNVFTLERIAVFLLDHHFVSDLNNYSIFDV